MTDTELIGRVVRRDSQAFDLFYERYAQIIFNLCVRILKDEAEAEDVMQEIFVQIWKEAERFDVARASVKTWLFTIARSRSLDRYRSRKAVQRRFEASPEENLAEVAAGANPEGISVMQQYVSGVLNRLSEEQRKVLEMSYFEGLTQEEIAEQLKEPLGTVKSRIRSGLMKLRLLFSGEKSND